VAATEVIGDALVIRPCTLEDSLSFLDQPVPFGIRIHRQASRFEFSDSTILFYGNGVTRHWVHYPVGSPLFTEDCRDLRADI